MTGKKMMTVEMGSLFFMATPVATPCISQASVQALQL